MPITKGFRTLVDEATAQITTYTVADVLARLGENLENDPRRFLFGEPVKEFKAP